MQLAAYGLMFFLLATAYAEPARSPVMKALSASGTAASLGEVIKAMDAGGRARALGALDRIDRSALAPADQSELAEAYRLLERPDATLDRAVARDGEAKVIFAMAQAGEYGSAQAAAEKALQRSPGDKNLLALLHQVKGRVIVKSASTPPAPLRPGTAAATAPASAGRPLVFPAPAAKTKAEPPPLASADSEGAAYVSGGAKKRSGFGLLMDGFLSMGVYNLDRESANEKARMSELRKSIESTDSGKALISDLGGWEKIDREVDMRFVWMRSRNTGAYVRPLMTGEKRYALAVNSRMMNAPDAIAAPILAHELSHIRDHQAGDMVAGLHIPSEYAAHRTQIHVFQELKKRMTPSQIEDLKTRSDGNYLLFITMLWEDHLQERFRNSADMAKATGDHRRYSRMAEDVFADLQTKKVAPGSPQLDYHLNSETNGLYRLMTSEKDIVDLVKENPATTPSQRARDAVVLNRRERLLSLAEKRDQDFRSKYGFVIPENK